MELRPGDKISEAGIAAQFGVSRTPIREALRKLQGQGLVEIVPNRYAQVATFDAEHVHQMGIVRLELESLAMRLAIFYGSNADFDHLRQTADACMEASQKGDITLQNRMDIAFHREIAVLSKNRYIEKYLDELELQIQMLMAAKYHPMPDTQEQMGMHYDILDAMMARDEALAIRRIHEHLVPFYGLDEEYPFFTSA